MAQRIHINDRVYAEPCDRGGFDVYRTWKGDDYYLVSVERREEAEGVALVDRRFGSITDYPHDLNWDAEIPYELGRQANKAGKPLRPPAAYDYAWCYNWSEGWLRAWDDNASAEYDDELDGTDY